MENEETGIELTETEKEYVRKLSRRKDYHLGHCARERLYVELTADELREKGQELAALEKEYDETERDAKDSAKGYRESLKSQRSEIQRAVTIIDERREERMVKVVDRADYRSNEMETIRVDTGEVVRSRPLTSDELQGTMFGEA